MTVCGVKMAKKDKKFVLYKKVSESSSKEYLIALLYSMEKVYTAKGRTWIDPDYKIEVEDEGV